MPDGELGQTAGDARREALRPLKRRRCDIVAPRGHAIDCDRTSCVGEDRRLAGGARPSAPSAVVDLDRSDPQSMCAGSGAISGTVREKSSLSERLGARNLNPADR